MSELFIALDPPNNRVGVGDVRKSLSFADNMENWSCTLIMHSVDQEKSMNADGVGSRESPEVFPRYVFLLRSRFLR